MSVTHCEMWATVTNRQGERERVWAGYQQAWAVEDGVALAPWKRMKRAEILNDLGVCDSRGFKVRWEAVPVED